MIRHLLFTLLLIFIPSTFSAQHLKLTFGGGLATQSGDAKSVGAYKLGLGYEYEFDQHWSVTPGLVFVGKGWKDPNKMVPVIDDEGNPMLDDDGKQVYSLMGRSTSANYIEVPILISYYHRLGESKYVVFSAGPYAALGLTGKVKTKGDGEQMGSAKLFYEGNTFDEEGARRFDAGIQAFVGYQFPAGFTLGLEADFGLCRFKKGGYRNISGLISLSYSFK